MRYRLSNELSTKEIAQELFVLNRQSGKVCTFNKTGAEIFRQLQQNRDTMDIINSLVTRFEVTKERAQSDVGIFIEELRHLGFIIDKIS